MAKASIPSELFIPFLEDSQPLAQYKKLFRAFQTAILNQQLASGAKLPSSRALAESLGISRNTVKTAYEMLQAEGYIDTQHGAGSFVSGQLQNTPTSVENHSSHSAAISSLAQQLSQLDRPAYQQAPGLLAPAQPSLMEFPWQQWQRHVAKASQIMKHQVSDSFQGYLPLREQLAHYLKVVRGVNCHSGQIIITAGSQQALSLSLALVLDPSDGVYLEDPGYPGIDGSLATVGARPILVGADHAGFNLDTALSLDASGKAALVTPSRNYPLGHTLSLERRLALLQWAKEQQRWVIEDDYDSEFRFDGPPITAMQGLGDGQQVLYIGTFSRVLHPSIRLGYLVVPESLVEPTCRLKRYLDGGLSALPQIALAEFMAAGQFSRHVRKMRKLYLERQTLLIQQLAKHCPELEYLPSDGGMHAVFLSTKIDDKTLCQQANQRGLGLRALSHYYRSVAPVSGLVIGFAGFSESQIIEGCQRLGDCYRQLETQAKS